MDFLTLGTAFVLVHALKTSQECIAISHHIVCLKTNVQGLLMEFPSNCKHKTLGQLFVPRSVGRHSLPVSLWGCFSPVKKQTLVVNKVAFINILYTLSIEMPWLYVNIFFIMPKYVLYFWSDSCISSHNLFCGMESSFLKG